MMADGHDRYDNDGNGGGSFVMGLLTGTVLGAGLGMLFAPRVGSELRNQLAEQAGTLATNAQDGYRRASETAQDGIRRASETAQRASETAQDSIRRVSETAQDGYRRASETAGELAGKGKEFADKGREFVDRAKDAVTKGAEEASRYARETAGAVTAPAAGTKHS
jgi:gas vesicle protein